MSKWTKPGSIVPIDMDTTQDMVNHLTEVERLHSDIIDTLAEILDSEHLSQQSRDQMVAIITSLKEKSA
jgi:hypothetical protein